MLGFYADDAHLSIVNAAAPQNSPFELCGKTEIAKHLRVAFGQETSHCVEREVVGKERVTFRETCEYPDDSRVVVETTLEVHDGKIVRQADVVANEARADRKEELGRRPLIRKNNREPAQGWMSFQPAISHDTSISDGKEGTNKVKPATLASQSQSIICPSCEAGELRSGGHQNGVV